MMNFEKIRGRKVYSCHAVRWYLVGWELVGHVGAGPATLFWAMALEKIRTLDCTEICVEGIKTLHDFVLSGAISRCLSGGV